MNEQKPAGMRKKRMPAGKFYGKASKLTVDYF